MLHESLAHERLKSSIAFRKPATHAVSGHPARTEGLYVGLDDRESHGAHGAAWLAVKHQLSAVGGRILLADRDARLWAATHSADAIGSCPNAIRALISTCR